MKRNSLPIDGYVIDHNTKQPPKLFSCSYCNDLTENYSRDTLTGVIDSDHACDNCYNEWKASQPFD